MIVFTAGGFDPFHEGHLKLIKKCRSLSAFVIVSVATNDHMEQKKGFYFMDEKARREIIQNIEGVTETEYHLGEDGTVNENLIRLRHRFPNRKIIFAKGGEWTKDNIPEKDVCKENNIVIVDNLVGTLNSSSGLVERAVELYSKGGGKDGRKKEKSR